MITSSLSLPLLGVVCNRGGVDRRYMSVSSLDLNFAIWSAINEYRRYAKLSQLINEIYWDRHWNNYPIYLLDTLVFETNFTNLGWHCTTGGNTSLWLISPAWLVFVRGPEYLHVNQFRIESKYAPLKTLLDPLNFTVGAVVYSHSIEVVGEAPVGADMSFSRPLTLGRQWWVWFHKQVINFRNCVSSSWALNSNYCTPAFVSQLFSYFDFVL